MLRAFEGVMEHILSAECALFTTRFSEQVDVSQPSMIEIFGLSGKNMPILVAVHRSGKHSYLDDLSCASIRDFVHEMLNVITFRPTLTTIYLPNALPIP